MRHTDPMVTMPSAEHAAALFQPLRPRLIQVARRMLGSAADAEDIVQEAFLRWLTADSSSVRDAEAWLRRVVMRLCLDYLKSARHRRETYVGPWLPEPVVDGGASGQDEVTLPLLLALERLSPLERASFLLHDVFGLSFEEVADTLGREAAACRQLASRARTHVRAERPRFPVPGEQGLRFAEAFFQASRHGDLQRLRELLCEDVVAYADGGGRVAATPVPVVGIEAVIDLHASLARLFAEKMSRVLRFAFLSGLPGFISVEQGDILQTTALEIHNGQVAAIYVTHNPDKLIYLRGQIEHQG